MAEGGALLRRYTGLNPYRGFESLSLRQTAFGEDLGISMKRRQFLGTVLSGAQTLGLTVPLPLLRRADETIR